MKKVGIFLYIVLIIVATFFLVPVFYIKGSDDFIKNNQALFEESHLDLVSGTIIAFKRNGTSAYVSKTPLFSESYLKEDNGQKILSLDLNVYTIVVKEKKQHYSGFVIIIENGFVNEEYLGQSIVKGDSGEYLFRVDLTFNKPLIIKNNPIPKAVEIAIPLYDHRSGILFFDYRVFFNDDGPVEIDKLNVSIPLETKNYMNLLTLTNTNYIGDIEEDKFINGNKNIDNITSTNLDILENIDLETIDDNVNLYYNEELLKSYKSKYNYFPLFVITWILIVSLITYLLFARKYVKLKREQKRRKKDLELKLMKEKFIEEEK